MSYINLDLNIMAHSNTVAAFDFDGTITTKDTLPQFIKHCFGNSRFFFGMFMLSPILLLFKLKVIRNDLAKQILFSYYFKGMKKQKFLLHCDSFKDKIDGILSPNALEKIDFHYSENHYLVIVSASIEDWIKPWVQKNNKFDYVIGTKIAFDSNNKITGRFLSKNCYGKQKAVRLKEHITDIAHKTLFAYGDSTGDKELLSMADFSFYQKFTD